ncbi:MAG: hypothetical protein NTZ07_00785, partial [Candidatus Woesebacteria bacterium]|nr:hypothetical protein [Candidatus Woesebacteria bacterium]
FVFVLIAVWVLVLCIIYTFKIPYVLINTLISVYISIITAPVQILAGTIAPSMGFGVWFKRLMADILVFPVVGLLFWFAWATLWTSYGQAFKDVASYWVSFGTINWIPGIIGTKGLGQPSGIDGIIFLAISFGIMTLIPKVPDMLKGVIMGEKFSFGTAMGEAYGPVSGIVKQGTGVASGVAQGTGALLLGSTLEAKGSGLLKRAGGVIAEYGNKSLGQATGKRMGVTKTVGPGEEK